MFFKIDVFLWNLRNFLEHQFLQNTIVTASIFWEISKFLGECSFWVAAYETARNIPGKCIIKRC